MDVPVSRRAALRSIGLLTLGAAGCLSEPSQDHPTQTSTPSGPPSETPPIPESVTLDSIATGFQAPVGITFVPDTNTCYIIDQPGLVYRSTPDGLQDTPVLNLTNQIDAGGEKGLLGIALHPAFTENNRVYLRYSTPPRPGTPDTYSHTFVLAEFTTTQDGTTIDPGTERIILEIPQPQSNHNAGDIAFGPDGYLYVPVGDGGGANDHGNGHPPDWYESVSGGNGQDVSTNLLGSILRIDINTQTNTRNYGIPPDNPLADQPGLDEHYAWGFRNPWRLSFDQSDLYVGDVGQNQYEEVDLVTRGGNYGWNVKEATHCFQATECPSNTPANVRNREPLIDPIIEYDHSGTEIRGISVIGGYIYRGTELPGLTGRYVFGDLQSNGQLFVATRPDTAPLWPVSILPITSSQTTNLNRIFAFGRDSNGEIAVLGTGQNGGGAYRIRQAT